MSANERKPFHKVLAGWLMYTTGEVDLELLYNIAREAIIPDDHDEIVRIIDMKKLQVTSRWWENIKAVVLEQKAEAVARKAEKAKQVTDADRAILLRRALGVMERIAFSPHGEESRRAEAHRLSEKLNEAMHIGVAKEDFERILAWLG